MQLMDQLCYPLVHYLITHNVSSDQSPITVNRTNVTLYGVQAGETYAVEIIPHVLFRAGNPKCLKSVSLIHVFILYIDITIIPQMITKIILLYIL